MDNKIKLIKNNDNLELSDIEWVRPLFDYLHKECGVLVLPDGMSDIIEIVQKIAASQPPAVKGADADYVGFEKAAREFWQLCYGKEFPYKFSEWVWARASGKGAEWVRCSQKFPEDWIEKIIRNRHTKKLITEENVRSADPDCFVMEDGSILCYRDCEWLDEASGSPTAAGELNINREWLTDLLRDFTVWYTKSKKKDLSNDVADFLDQRLEGKGVNYVLDENERLTAAGDGKEAIDFKNWTMTDDCRYYWMGGQEWRNMDNPKEPITTAQLYDIFKQQNK